MADDTPAAAHAHAADAAAGHVASHHFYRHASWKVSRCSLTGVLIRGERFICQVCGFHVKRRNLGRVPLQCTPLNEAPPLLPPLTFTASDADATRVADPREAELAALRAHETRAVAAPAGNHWVLKGYNRWPRCAVCAKKIWGWFPRVYKCARTGVVVHDACRAAAATNAPGNTRPVAALQPLRVDGDGTRPTIAFFNAASGGKQAGALAPQLRHLLTPRQVFDVMAGGGRRPPGPTPGLQQHAGVDNLHMIVCGGDGTCRWALSALENADLGAHPPMAVLPLGTGNDLARTFGWGGGYKGGDITKFIDDVGNATPIELDRWNVRVQPHAADEPAKEEMMINYVSVGVDAYIAHKFHSLRERKPHLFFSQTVNLVWYALYGVAATFARLPKCHKYLRLEIDGAEVPIPTSVRCVVVLNVPSFAGGTDLWNLNKVREGESKCSVNDGLLEVVGSRDTIQLGLAHVGLVHAKRIGQGRNVRLTVREEWTKAVSMQIDGEPWEQAPALIDVSHVDRAHMLLHPKGSKYIKAGSSH